MNVEILASTPNPIEIISLAAGTSYGRDDISKKRIETCIHKGHLSVLEHVCVTFKISGVSRSCTHQLVRHRLASFTEKSLRYTEPQEGEDWYVTPPAFFDLGEDHCEKYDKIMNEYAKYYRNALNSGILKEDARFLLPLATKTEITVTMNLREFFHFYDLRSEKNAQWEIRELAWEMFDEIRDLSPDWKWLLETYCIDKGQKLYFADNPGLAFAAQ